MKLTLLVMFFIIGVSFGDYHYYQTGDKNNAPYGGGKQGYYEGRDGDLYSSRSSRSSSSSSSSESEESDVNPACGTCSKLAIKTGSGSGSDETITQTITRLSNGCTTISVTCKAKTVGSKIYLFLSKDETNVKTESGTTTITRNLVCNINGQLGSVEGEVPDKVECVSSPIPCSICRTPLRLDVRPVDCTVTSTTCSSSNVISVTCVNDIGTGCKFYLEKELNSENFVDIGLTANIRCDSNGFYIGDDMIGRLKCDSD